MAPAPLDWIAPLEARLPPEARLRYVPGRGKPDPDFQARLQNRLAPRIVGCRGEASHSLIRFADRAELEEACRREALRVLASVEEPGTGGRGIALARAGAARPP